MSIVSKLISMYALGHAAAETRAAAKNVLIGLVGSLILALAAGLMVGALLFGLHVALYFILMQMTLLTSLEAVGVTLLVGLLVTAAVVAATIHKTKAAFTLTKQLQIEEPQQLPVASRVVGIAEAFFDGLTGRTRYR